MAYRNPLEFSNRPFRSQLLSMVFQEQINSIAREIEHGSEELLNHSNPVHFLTGKYTLELIAVHWEQKKITCEKRTVSARDMDPVRVIRSGLMQGQTVQENTLIHSVPCSGSLNLFWLMPTSSILLSMPPLHVYDDCIRFEIFLNELYPDDTKKEIEHYTSFINQHVYHLNNDLMRHNQSLPQVAANFLEVKRKKTDKMAAILNHLGITVEEEKPDTSRIDTKHNVKKNIGYYSVAISYGGLDELHAEKINQYLKRNGVTTWFYKEDKVPGKKLHRTMFDLVNNADRIILLCSHTSLNRSGVQNEIERVLEREAKESGSSILIPIALNDFDFSEWEPERKDLADQVRSRNYIKIDMENFESDATQKQLDRLLKALKK